MADADDHAAYVEGWLARQDEQTTLAWLELLERAVNALCARLGRTLSDVTLAAIVDRVLYGAAERYPFLSAAAFSRADDHERAHLSCAGIAREALPDAAVAKEALAAVLTELLVVLGNLTAEILTPASRQELDRLAQERARQ